MRSTPGPGQERPYHAVIARMAVDGTMAPSASTSLRLTESAAPVSPALRKPRVLHNAVNCGGL